MLVCESCSSVLMLLCYCKVTVPVYSAVIAIVAYIQGSQFSVMRYSGSCNISTDNSSCSGQMQFVDAGGEILSIEILSIKSRFLFDYAVGCNAEDFESIHEGAIALLWYNNSIDNCSLYDKVSLILKRWTSVQTFSFIRHPMRRMLESVLWSS